MKSITKYVADDGNEFASEADCRQYEAMCEQVQRAIGRLARKPDLTGREFENGGGYLQHDPNTVTEVRAELLRVANAAMPHRWFEQSLADPTANPSWVGHLIGKMGYLCLWKAWDRISCTRSDGREYGHPYFAAHPDEAKNVCFNKVEA